MANLKSIIRAASFPGFSEGTDDGIETSEHILFVEKTEIAKVIAEIGFIQDGYEDVPDEHNVVFVNEAEDLRNIFESNVSYMAKEAVGYAMEEEAEKLVKEAAEEQKAFSAAYEKGKNNES